MCLFSGSSRHHPSTITPFSNEFVVYNKQDFHDEFLRKRSPFLAKFGRLFTVQYRQKLFAHKKDFVCTPLKVPEDVNLFQELLLSNWASEAPVLSSEPFPLFPQNYRQTTATPSYFIKGQCRLQLKHYLVCQLLGPVARV